MARVWRRAPALLRGLGLVLLGVAIGSLLSSSLIPTTHPASVRQAIPALKLRDCAPCSNRQPGTKPVTKGLINGFQALNISVYKNSSYLSTPPLGVKVQSLPQHLEDEYSIREMLTIAVFTNQDHLKMANAVYDSWGQSANRIAFFVGEDFNVTTQMATGLPLVKVPGVRDHQVNSIRKTFQVLKYLSDNHLTSSHWFLLASDNTYVRVERLKDVLSELASWERVYLGRAGSGRPGEHLSLSQAERYCLGGTGVVLSQGLLAALTPHLEKCLSGAMSGESGAVSEWADVELGRCVSRMTGTQCSQSSEVKGYFLADYSGSPPTLESLNQPHFSELITYHPVSDQTTMNILHGHFTRLAFQASLEHTNSLQTLSESFCTLTGANDCHTPLCECPVDKCPSMGMIKEAPKSFNPSNIYDYQSWQYFDDRTLYTDKFVLPSSALQQKKDTRKELQVMLGKAVQSATERFGRHLKFKRLLNGWVRHNPFRGSEYIVDCLFTDVFLKVVERRVSLVRPLASNYITLRDSSDSQTVVNFVVPLSNVNSRFQEFMSMYESIALAVEERVRLVLAVYGAEDLAFVNKIVDGYRNKYPLSMISVVEGKGTFSRGKALHLAMAQLRSHELAFMCDIDMVVSRGFIDRCRKNTLQGKRVYYPEFFKLYNLDYVYRDGVYPIKVPLKRKHGHWAYYSFGMLCIYKSDYSAAGGMNTNIIGWGEEDVKFFESVVRKKLEVLRAPDPGLSHRWHEKTCPASLSKTQHAHCLTSRGENLADRIELANFIYEKKVHLQYDQHSMPHAVQLAMVNQTFDIDPPLNT